MLKERCIAIYAINLFTLVIKFAHVKRYTILSVFATKKKLKNIWTRNEVMIVKIVEKINRIDAFNVQKVIKYKKVNVIRKITSKQRKPEI